MEVQKSKPKIKFNDKAKSIPVVTPIFRVSFPKLFVAEQYENKGEYYFSVAQLYPKNTDFKSRLDKNKKQISVMEAIDQAKLAAFGKDKTKWPKCQSPFKDGNEKSYAGYQDTLVLNSKSKTKPTVLDTDKTKITCDSNHSEELYAGCYARAQLGCKINYVNKTYFTNFYLQGIMKVRDGEKLGSSFDDSAFDEFEDESNGDYENSDDSNDDESESEEYEDNTSVLD